MRNVICLGLCVLFAAGLLPAAVSVGARIPDFKLTDTGGNAVDFAALKGGTTVILFVATKCPVSNAYNERMNALYRDYSARGVKFVAINSNTTEPASEVAAHAKSSGFGFTVYKDENSVVADQLGAQVTPETFVIDAAGSVLYHGSIDDSQNATRIQFQGLRTALDSILAGKAVEKAETKAFGCTIKRAKR